MHPQIRQPDMGPCPLCGMDLITASSGGDSELEPNMVSLSERARSLAKLRTTLVHRRGDAATQLRLLGNIQPDESSLKTVTAWTSGRIDRLKVRVTGESVKAGQSIATLYSPEVFAAHQDSRLPNNRLSGSRCKRYGASFGRCGSESGPRTSRLLGYLRRN